jgi:hypothetical protein
MSDYKASDYTFLGLWNYDKRQGRNDSLAYLVGLVDSANHKILDFRTAGNLLTLLFDIEEEQVCADNLLAWQRQFLCPGYYPQTPCMLTKEWSPIGAMLEQGFDPVALGRTPKRGAVATGIWRPADFESMTGLRDSHSVEQMFWAIISEAFRRAKERKMLVSLIAEPGWAYDLTIASLKKWSNDDIAKADRILWKRKPED